MSSRDIRFSASYQPITSLQIVLGAWKRVETTLTALDKLDAVLSAKAVTEGNQRLELVFFLLKSVPYENQ